MENNLVWVGISITATSSEHLFSYNLAGLLLRTLLPTCRISSLITVTCHMVIKVSIIDWSFQHCQPTASRTKIWAVPLTDSTQKQVQCFLYTDTVLSVSMQEVSCALPAGFHKVELQHPSVVLTGILPLQRATVKWRLPFSTSRETQLTKPFFWETRIAKSQRCYTAN